MLSKNLKIYYAICVISSAIAMVHCQVSSIEDSGQYVPDFSGQYVHDDSGRYVHDRSGDYVHDGLGNYLNDNGGFYRGEASNTYQKESNFQRQSKYSHLKESSKFSIITDYFAASNNQPRKIYYNPETQKPKSLISSTNLLGASSSVNTQFVKPSKPLISEKSIFGNIAAASSPVSATSNTKYDQARYVDGHWKIIRQAEENSDDGYHWEYETENGITAEETGKLANKGTDKEGMKAKGFYQYTGPDKVLYSVGYTADDNGFVAVGNHIPTPPPIPIEIQKSLDYLKSVGKL
ncbi:hypothetical protein FQR65_LT01153 [Abscondita terminalis]|nr:hypothetical protein FQR65_LT01153 [Abscondita terminalis]